MITVVYAERERVVVQVEAGKNLEINFETLPLKDESQAEMYAKAIHEHITETLREIRRVAYEQGYSDHKKHNRKPKRFSGGNVPAIVGER